MSFSCASTSMQAATTDRPSSLVFTSRQSKIHFASPPCLFFPHVLQYGQPKQPLCIFLQAVYSTLHETTLLFSRTSASLEAATTNRPSSSALVSRQPTMHSMNRPFAFFAHLLQWWQLQQTAPAPPSFLPGSQQLTLHSHHVHLLFTVGSHNRSTQLLCIGCQAVYSALCEPTTSFSCASTSMEAATTDCLSSSVFAARQSTAHFVNPLCLFLLHQLEWRHPQQTAPAILY